MTVGCATYAPLPDSYLAQHQGACTVIHDEVILYNKILQFNIWEYAKCYDPFGTDNFIIIAWEGEDNKRLRLVASKMAIRYATSQHGLYMGIRYIESLRSSGRNAMVYELLRK